MSRDYRDLVVEQFADDEQQLLERLASVEDDCETYRALAQEAIQQLHALTQAHQQLREQHRRVLGDYQRLRAHLITTGMEAA